MTTADTEALPVAPRQAGLAGIRTPHATPEPSIPGNIWRVQIPALDVDTGVMDAPRTPDSWDIQGLKTRLAWLEGTAAPGEGGNTVLAGHVTVLGGGQGPFYYLHHLRAGDEIRVYSESQVYVYAVEDQSVVRVDAVEITSQEYRDRLTLFTCTGWDEDTEEYQARRVVYAGLLSVEPYTEQALPVE